MTNKRLRFIKDIPAPVATVWSTMLAPDSYEHWTAAFCEGSHYDGAWEEGERIRFLAPNGDGMVAEIAELRPREFVSIRHLGFIHGGVEDTESDAIRAWAPAYENYSFEATLGGTRLVIDQDVTEDFEAMMKDAWPKALNRLESLCVLVSDGDSTEA
ncbi:MAG: SRPBCC domain-containing protein [Planctomycetes bacterium]|nr:SRPBCC domain-containing protein [Planctomycetota bacterium]MCB9891273.1 SRPBCC domain-containing protein [Planctomycetota bacterium]MCB9919468.1 SRPBCC domain-containing protein [Planctomycetota bacterium]